MPFGHDHSVINLKFSERSDQGAAGSAFRITGLAYDSFDAKLAAVSYGYLDLCLFTEWAEYGNILKSSLWTHKGQDLFAYKMTGLA